MVPPDCRAHYRSLTHGTPGLQSSLPEPCSWYLRIAELITGALLMVPPDCRAPTSTKIFHNVLRSNQKAAAAAVNPHSYALRALPTAVSAYEPLTPVIRFHTVPCSVAVCQLTANNAAETRTHAQGDGHSFVEPRG
eukprot:355984-Chlamydomonas_euryale.AAC.8